MAINKIFLEGHVGKDPEVKHFESGQQVSKFSIAVNEGYKNKAGEWENKTMWVDIISWGRSAEYVEKNVTKGMKVVVEGKLSMRSYENKEGVKKYITEVVSSSIAMLSSRSSGAFAGLEDTSEYTDVDASAPAKTNFTEASADGGGLEKGDLDDLPF